MLTSQLAAFNNVYAIAAVWIGLAFLASAVSLRLGLSVALVEVLVGVAAGNLFHLATNTWIDFLAGFGSVLLTFLAGAEIDPGSLRRFLAPSLAIGGVGFAAPFAGAWAFAWFLLHWHWQAAQIAGVALSTTSVAVVYAVMVETGLNKTDLGKLILTACFVCDLGTVLALGGLATAAKSEAVLPAYLLGLVAASTFHQDPKLMGRIRGTAFSFLTPFFFLKAGTLISLPAVVAGLGAVLALFAVKIVAKVAGVFPATFGFGVRGRQGWYATMMMSTGLTFGSISALFGYTHGFIDRGQYSVLVTVVVMTALVPTLIAQTLFQPRSNDLSWGRPMRVQAEAEPVDVA